MLPLSKLSTQQLRILTGCVIFTISLIGSQAFAMDKRTFVHTVKPGTHAFHLVIVDSGMSADQYRPNGQLQTTVENDALLAKAIARFSIAQNLELTFEIPYFLERIQKRTNASGISVNRFDSQGVGDVNLQLTRQWRDSRKGGVGFLTGVELKFPTGEKEKGLGSDTWDISLRSVLSYKTAWGFPFGMAIYTATGTTKIDGVRTYPGNDLYMAAGFKSRLWNGFGATFSAYRYFATSRTINVNNGSPVYLEKYDAPGWKIYGRHRISKSFEWNLFYETNAPEDHKALINGTAIDKKLDDKERFGAIIKFFW